MYTYQKFMQDGITPDTIQRAIAWHRGTEAYKIALSADEYDKQKNETITRFANKLFDVTGRKVNDITSSNNRLASNLFHRLNTQRCMYSLGNGVTFAVDEGSTLSPHNVKARLGDQFDHWLAQAAYLGLIHGTSFIFLDTKRVYVFPLTEFVPLYDENTGALRAGIRFWRVSSDTPLQAVLYEKDGFTKYASKKRDDKTESGTLELVEAKRPYVLITATTPADNDVEVIGAENYTALPIVPLYGSQLKQSTLVGMRESIDSFDLIKSGFANDLTDCAQIYWLLNGTGGMDDDDLQRFIDRLRLSHVAVVDGNGADPTTEAKAFTQEPPYVARQNYLNMIKADIYEDFGALDVHTIQATSTNDHIDAAYQPLDEEASDFEYQVSEAIKGLLKLLDIQATPVFKRQRISNQKEQVELLSMESAWLDDETILSKLPNVSPDEITQITARRETDLVPETAPEAQE